MRLKILLFPLAIVLSLVIGIVYVQPEASRAWAMRGESDTLGQKESEMKTAADNAAPLAQMLEKNASLEQSVLNQYFPQQANSEVIVDSLGLLASQAGVTLDTVTSQQNESVEAPVADAPTEGVLPDPTLASGSDSSMPEEVVPPVTVQTVTVQVSGKGAYPNIKDFLHKVAYTNRFNAVDQISITQATDATGTASGALGFSAQITFSFLPTVKHFKNASADSSAPSVFAQSNLNTEAVKRLNDFLTKGASVVPPMVPVDGAGRANPFVK